MGYFFRADLKFQNLKINNFTLFKATFTSRLFVISICSKKRSELNFLPSRSALIQFTNCYIITEKKKTFCCALKIIRKGRKKGTKMRKLLRICWWIFVLFFRCISGSTFNIRAITEKVKVLTVETFHLSSLFFHRALIKTLISFYASGNHPLRRQVLKSFQLERKIFLRM